MHKLLLAVLSQLIKFIGTDVNQRCKMAMVSTAWVLNIEVTFHQMYRRAKFTTVPINNPE